MKINKDKKAITWKQYIIALYGNTDNSILFHGNKYYFHGNLLENEIAFKNKIKV